MNNKNINKAYQHCLDIAKNHYENFPVASIFLPKTIRLPIAAVYAFARQADDYADEGDISQTERIKLLTECEQKLKNIESDLQISENDKIYLALSDTIKRFDIPIQLFFDLLKAFKQDVEKTKYSNFAEILDYCKLSANPVGRILLYLTKSNSEENLELSDNICSSLQLINFLQDIHSDAIDRNRCYLPMDEMQQFGIKFTDLINKEVSSNYNQFIHMQTQKAEQLMLNGKKLGGKLNGIFGFEIRLIISGGETILNELYNRSDLFERPTLKLSNWIKIFFNALQKSKFN